MYSMKCVRAVLGPSIIHHRKLKTEVSLWKHIKCFLLHSAGGIQKRDNQKSVLICVWGKPNQGKSHHFRKKKIRFQNDFSPLKFPRFEMRFHKALFVWRISEDGGPSRHDKAAFSFLLQRSMDPSLTVLEICTQQTTCFTSHRKLWLPRPPFSVDSLFFAWG